jgi:hypothetical protein
MVVLSNLPLRFHVAMLVRSGHFALISCRIGASLLSAETIDFEYGVYIKSVPKNNQRNCN